MKVGGVWVPWQDGVRSCDVHRSLYEQIVPSGADLAELQTMPPSELWSVGHGIPVGFLSCLGEAASPELGREAGLRMLLAVGTFQPRMMAQTFSFS